MLLNGVMQMKQMLIKLQTLYGDEDFKLSSTLSDLQSLEDVQEEYMVQLETERMLLLNKVNDLGQELLNSTPSQSWTAH